MEIVDHQDLPTSEDEHDAGDEPAQTSISDAQDSAPDNHREQETKSPKELGDVSLDVGTADTDASEYDDEPMTFTDSTQQGGGAGWSPQDAGSAAAAAPHAHIQQFAQADTPDEVTRCTIVSFYASVVLLWSITWFFHPPLAITEPLLAIPFYLLYRWWYQHRRAVAWRKIVVAFALGFWPAALGILFVRVIIFAIMRAIVNAFWFDMSDENAMDNEVVFRSFIVSLFSAIVVEVAKLIYARVVRKSRGAANASSDTKADLLLNTAVALGYSTMDNVLLLVFNIEAYESSQFGVQLGFAIAQTLWLFVISTPLQCLTAYLICLVVAKEHVTNGLNFYWTGIGFVLPVCILFRTISRFQATVWFTFTGIIGGLILSLIVGVALLAGMAYFIRTVEKTLPSWYLRQTGYLNAMGHALLDLDDDDDMGGNEVPSAEMEEMDDFQPTVVEEPSPAGHTDL